MYFMDKSNPLVSVVIPAYNAEAYVKETIESALAQTYGPLEIVVVNDGSTDRTADILKMFGDQITVITQKNQGLSAARNAGIKIAKGEYLAFLDADDIYFPERIEKQIAFMLIHPEFKISYCNMFHFYDGKPERLYRHQAAFPSGDVFENLLYEFFGQWNTMLVSKTVFDRVGLFDDSSRFSEDWDMNLRIARAGYRFGFLDEPLFKMRITGSGLSNMDNQWKMKARDVEIFEKLAEKMTPEEREKYHMATHIQRLRWKLGVAYLSGGKKDEALREFKENKSSLSIVITYLLPISVLKFLVRVLWKRKQRGLLKPV